MSAAEERWARALDALSLIRTVITDPGAGYELPSVEACADAIDYAIAEIKLTVEPAALEAAGFE